MAPVNNERTIQQPAGILIILKISESNRTDEIGLVTSTPQWLTKVSAVGVIVKYIDIIFRVNSRISK